MKTKSIYNKSDILDMRYKMPLAHVTKTGNVSIPKKWRLELGIKPGSNVVMELKNNKIVIESLKEKKNFYDIDQEVKEKKIKFTRKEAIRDDFYD